MHPDRVAKGYHQDVLIEHSQRLRLDPGHSGISQGYMGETYGCFKASYHHSHATAPPPSTAAGTRQPTVVRLYTRL